MTRLFLVLALPIVVIIVHDIVRRPVLRRVAFRNVSRRRGEAALVVLGSLLGTAIITASFIVGDTLGSSIRDVARTQLGPTDEVATVTDPARLPAVEQALRAPIAGTDGTLAVMTSPAAIATPGRDPRAEPHASIAETDFDAARRFGADPGATGMAKAGPTPTGDEIVIAHDLAKTLEVRAGDTIDVYALGGRSSYRVRAVLPKVGLVGFGGAFVAPGTIARLASAPAAASTAPPSGHVLVSNTGGVFNGADGTTPVLREMRRRVAPVGGVATDDVKRSLLKDADNGAKSFTTLFGAIGSFGVIAGILLLINIFVMLAEERKSELGMIRAVGMKRNQLVRAFGMEGGIYAVLSAIAGAIVGIGVGRAIVVVANSLFNSSSDGNGLRLVFRASPQSLIGGAVLGGAIGLVTVWLSSLRLGRLNIIRAIREIPEPVLRQQRLRTVILGVVGMVVGGLLFATGASAGKSGWFGAMTGIPIAAYCAIPLFTRFLPRRAVITTACLIGLMWPVACFTVLPDVFGDIDIPAFVVQGVLLVAAAVAGGATNADIAGHLIERVVALSRGLAARLGFAYPLARKFRTSMLLVIYALIVFTMTFLATVSNMFSGQAPQFVSQNRAGYDVIIDSNPGNPLSSAQLDAQPEVVASTSLLQAFPKFSSPTHRAFDYWGMTGIDEGFVSRGVVALGSRQSKFASDRAAWDAVIADPTLVITSDFFQEEGGPNGPAVRNKVGDTVIALNPSTGVKERYTIAGILNNDVVDVGAVVNKQAATALMGREAVATRQYAAVRPGADAAAVATRLTGRFLGNGAEAKSIVKVVDEQLAQNQGFFRLMEGYLVLGLLIGVAGLGVVMVRAVRERRRQIGMLRAMGFSSRVVRRSFLIESAFVAGQGIIIGMVLALVVSYQLLYNSKTFGDTNIPFSVPWPSLAILGLIALGGSLIATVGPAGQASKIQPAVALRIAD